MPSFGRSVSTHFVADCSFLSQSKDTFTEHFFDVAWAELKFNICDSVEPSLKGTSLGYPWATMKVVPDYFQGKIEEKWSQKQSLAV